MKKVIVVNQKDFKDCGVCALQSIIRYYGGYVSIEKLREDTYTTMKGTSVFHIMEAAKKYGFNVQAKKYLDKDINEAILPAIVHVKYPNGLLHFMVLYNSGKKLVLMDPAKGKVSMSKLEFDSIFTGVVIEFSASRPITLLSKEKSIYNLFFKILASNKKICLNILLVSMLVTFFTIASGLYFKVGYEMVVNNSDIKLLWFIMIVFGGLLILKLVNSYLKSYLENHINKNIDISMLGEFINHCFFLPLKVISTRLSGEIISRVNELSSIKDLFSEIFVTSFLDLILSLGTIICLFYISWKLSLILCLVIFLYIIISLSVNKYIYKRVRQNIELQTEVNTRLIENIDMIDSIKNLNKTDKVLSNMERIISNLLYDNFTFTGFINKLTFIKDFVCEIGLFVINSYGFYLIYKGKFSLISLVTFNTLLTYFINPIKSIISILPRFNFLRATFSKITDFIGIEEEKIGEKEKFINGDIEFRNVSFSYDLSHNTLDNLSFLIKMGEKVMIKGHSGCGKSTICSLLQKKYEPSKGYIMINHKNIQDYSNRTIHENILYVGQKENLYTDTIKNNILFYRKDSKLFDKVCKVCKLDDIVSKKTFRYDFGIDNNANNISGGEKQRIILARALMSESKILILDEALSETDYQLEKEIILNIMMEFPMKTLIYISHKKHDNLFDRVIPLVNGGEYH